MITYVLSGERAKEFCKLANSLIVTGTAQNFIDYGFTNHDDPRLYWYRKIKEPDNYEISFGITIDKKTMKIDDIEILDEHFLQPSFCGDTEWTQVKKNVQDMIQSGLFTSDFKF
jgi:hypothetical protein